MTQAARLKSQLQRARKLSEDFLASFQTPEEWTHQVYPGVNHALWFAGHMAMADNYFVSLVSPQRAIDLARFDPLFGIKSKASGQPADYPPPAEVLAIMRDRRVAFLAALDELTDEQLAGPVPQPSLLFTDLASVFELAIWHEGLHSGQVSIARRSLGHEPVLRPPV